jgi:hypothetical protein
MSEALRNLETVLRSLGLARRIGGEGVRPQKQEQHITVLQLALADLVTRPVPQQISGFGFFVPIASNPASLRLRLNFGGGADFREVAPGDFAMLPFDGLSISVETDGAATGAANIVVFTSPDGFFASLASQLGSPVASEAVGPGGATTQTRNDADANIPTTAGDGVLLTGKKAFRVILSSGAGTTLSGGGRLNFWKRPTSIARWAPMPFAYTDLTAATDPTVDTRDWVGPEEQIFVPEGELYVEAKSVTSSGVGALSVLVETW